MTNVPYYWFDISVILLDLKLLQYCFVSVNRDKTIMITGRYVRQNWFPFEKSKLKIDYSLVSSSSSITISTMQRVNSYPPESMINGVICSQEVRVTHIIGTRFMHEMNFQWPYFETAQKRNIYVYFIQAVGRNDISFLQENIIIIFNRSW